MFVDDGHRASYELVEGPGSSTIQRQVRDGRRFRGVKVALNRDRSSARCESWAG